MAEEQCDGLGRRLEPVRSTVGGSDPGGRAAVACCLRRRRPVLNLGRKRMRRETQHAGGRLGPRSSPINDPDAKFSREEPEFFTKKEKGAHRKKGSEGEACGNCCVMEIDQGGLRQYFLDDFHSRLKKPYAKTRAFSQLPPARR